LYLGYGISVTNVNPGPVKTEFITRVETNKKMEQAAAAAGTTLTKSPWREVADGSGYLRYITDRMVAFLNQRTNAEGM
jgi:short-subunit dehydrogenase